MTNFQGKLKYYTFQNFEYSILSIFFRVYDRKVAILGLSSILRQPINQWPKAMTLNVQSAKSVMAACIQLLHQNVSHRRQKGK